MFFTLNLTNFKISNFDSIRPLLYNSGRDGERYCNSTSTSLENTVAEPRSQISRLDFSIHDQTQKAKQNSMHLLLRTLLNNVFL